MDEKILIRIRTVLGEQLCEDILGLLGKDKLKRKLSGKNILNLSSLNSQSPQISPSATNWLKLALVVRFLLKLSTLNPERYYNVELLEFLAIVHRAVRNEQVRISSTTESLEELRFQTSDSNLYVGLLTSLEPQERCVGSYCLSTLEPTPELLLILTHAFERENNPLAMAGYLMWAGQWSVYQNKLLEALSNDDCWLQGAAAWAFWGGSEQFLEGLDWKLLESPLTAIRRKPELWTLPGWGIPCIV